MMRIRFAYYARIIEKSGALKSPFYAAFRMRDKIRVKHEKTPKSSTFEPVSGV